MEMEVENGQSAELASETPENKEELYAYTKRAEFTSENFKIEVQGLPKYYGLGEFKKLLSKSLGLKPHKLKPLGPKTSAMFVAFRNEEDRTEAIKKLNGFRWKKNHLCAFATTAAPDPYVKKKNTEGAALPATEEELEQAVRKQTIPLFGKPYEEQLELKRKSTLETLNSVGKQLSKVNETLVPWWVKNKKESEGACCPVDPCLASPVIEGYRNKCEFTVGLHAVTQKPAIGFRLSSYKAGTTCVAPADNLAQVSSTMKKIVKVLQELVASKTSYPPYNPVDHSGYWKTITVRTNVANEAMVVVSFHCQALANEDLDAVKKDIVAALTQDSSLEGCIKSVYFKADGQAVWRPNSEAKLPEMEKIYGESNVEETLRGLKFRISPKSFFQCNTAGAEVLYNAVLNLAKLEADDSYLIDVCCGTGTIGIYAAHACKKVVGVEIVQEAIEDAKHNAKVNGLEEKMDFACGPAETLIVGLLKKLNVYGAGSDGKQNIVAIVDPPRAGLHRKVISALRREEDIQRLVYVSCDARAASQNFIDLGRPESKTYPGEPFLPTKAVPVDLYPHTQHIELVLLFERASRVLGVPRDVPEREPRPVPPPAPAAGGEDDEEEEEDEAQDHADIVLEND